MTVRRHLTSRRSTPLASLALVAASAVFSSSALAAPVVAAPVSAPAEIKPVAAPRLAPERPASVATPHEPARSTTTTTATTTAAVKATGETEGKSRVAGARAGLEIGKIARAEGAGSDGAPRATASSKVTPLPRTIELHQPAPMAETTVTGIHAVDGKVYSERVRSRDPLQGRAADCYLISSMVAVAQRSPELIRKAVTELPDGNLRVRLYDKAEVDGQTRYTPVDVIVDRNVPVDGNGPVYARGRETAWPALVEKAFASFKGSYDAIGHGGRTAVALDALTGKPSKTVFITAKTDRAELISMIETGVKEGRPVLAGTRMPADFVATMKEVGEAGTNVSAHDRLAAIADPASAHPYRDYGLVEGHEYTVLGVGKRDGETMIVLRNPWGYFEPGRHGIASGEVQKGGGNGVFAIRADEFALLFDETVVGPKLE